MVAAIVVDHCLHLYSSPSSSLPDGDDGDGGGDDGWRNSFSSSSLEFCNELCLCSAQFLITCLGSFYVRK